ncbi:MAG: hypothetical protein M3N48_02035 [Verrucomicrobiota bacterium]|nr:hypothetical protein [Verrucomicrobiota bacterium]
MADPKTDTVRIVLPSRPPVMPIRRLPPKITTSLSCESIVEAPSLVPRRPPVSQLALPSPSPLFQPLPKPAGVETSAAVGPFPPGGDVTATAAPRVITSRPVAPVDDIPRSLAWGLLGVSAVIFLIQIWNYVVS